MVLPASRGYDNYCPQLAALKVVDLGCRPVTRKNCPAGKWSDEEGLDRSSKCKDCPQGLFSVPGQLLAQPSACRTFHSSHDAHA